MMRYFSALGLAVALATPTAAWAEDEQVEAKGPIVVMKPVHFRGKPPYRRAATTVNLDVEAAPQVVYANRRVGAPGKQGTLKRRAFVETVQRVEEFARFEADSEAKAIPRRPWRGAPGKRRRLLSD